MMTQKQNLWATPATDAVLREMATAGDNSGKIRDRLLAEFNVTPSKDSILRRLKKIDGHEEWRKYPKQCRAIKPIIATQRPSQHESGRPGSVLNFRGLCLPNTKGVVVERLTGCCSWPLECREPATGRFCVEHSKLLRAA